MVHFFWHTLYVNIAFIGYKGLYFKNINNFVQFSLVMNALEIKSANGFNHQEQNDDNDDSDFLS